MAWNRRAPIPQELSSRRAQALSDLAENDADIIDMETADARARKEPSA